MLRSVVSVVVLTLGAWVPPADAAFEPGSRVLLDAHNCYPDHGRWADRLDRALSTGLPIAIEQDLVWYRDPVTGKGRSLVAHDEPKQRHLGLSGHEPTLEAHFFERIRPIVEQALRENDRDSWPIITLNLDFKTEEPEHLASLWHVLQAYRSWLTTAPRGASIDDIQPLSLGPVLVLTGESDTQQAAYHDALQRGDSLLAFGAAHPAPDGAAGRKSNYHRWSNNPWTVVEPGGQRKAGAWTSDDSARLRQLVDTAHQHGLWIRFYTLNGHAVDDDSGGWSSGYNFGSEAAARERWEAAIRAGVDFIATDQYEALAATLLDVRAIASTVVLRGTLTRDDYERLLERAFDVPPGIAYVEVSLDYSGGAERTVIDLGLRGPAGLRGWSGGGSQTIGVGSLRASPGYLPGPVEPGMWAVVLGVPNIRVGRRDDYTLTVRLYRAMPSASTSAMTALIGRGAGWFVGDLHTHSGHSDGRTTNHAGARVPAPAFRVFDAAASAGLDFVALTDHNTASHWLDVDRLQPSYDRVLLLHAREVTTYRGHANTIGERTFHDFRLGSHDAAGVRAVLGGPVGDGAFVSINHPASPDDERCMGCGWNDLDEVTLGLVHGVEIVNGSGEGAHAGWRTWADLLNRGYFVTAVGGSDDHTPDEDADRRVGGPATVVYASQLSEGAIVRGLKSGRAYVRTQGPDGPELDFWATAGGIRYEMGARAVPSGRVTLHAQLTGAEGESVTWIRNGNEIGRVTVAGAQPVVFEVEAQRGDWFSLIVQAGHAATAYSNAILVER